MAARNGTDDLTAALKNGTSYTGAGQFDGEHHTFLLQPEGQLSEASQYENLIVRQGNGAPVYLKDIANGKKWIARRTHQHAVLVPRQQVPAAMWSLRFFGAQDQTPSRLPNPSATSFSRCKRSYPVLLELLHFTSCSQGIVNSVSDVQATRCSSRSPWLSW